MPRAAEIADRRARKEAGLVARHKIGRQSYGLREIGDDRANIERGIALREARALRPPRAASRHVDWHIGDALRSAVEQDLGLQARAGAEFDEEAALAGPPRSSRQHGLQESPASVRVG